MPAATPAPQPSGASAHLLNTNILSDPTGQQLPIIQVQVQAPDATGAARLAGAAITGLREYLDSTAAQENIPDSSRLHVDALGVPQATLATRGPSFLLAVLSFVGVLVIGCGVVLAIPRLVHVSSAEVYGRPQRNAGRTWYPAASLSSRTAVSPRSPQAPAP